MNMMNETRTIYPRRFKRPEMIGDLWPLVFSSGLVVGWAGEGVFQ